MLIKVCGLKYDANIRLVLELKPDFMGFNFYKFSPRYVNQETLIALNSIDFGKTKKTGVFVNEDAEIVLSIAEIYHLDYIQLHGNESSEEARQIKKHFPVIKAIGIESKEDMQHVSEFEDSCDYILLDKKSPAYGGTGTPFDWKLLDHYSSFTPFFLGGGISPSNIERVKSIQHPRLVGVDVNSGFEDSPGVKSITNLKTVFTQ